MSGAPMRIMVDANVWIDSYCPAHAGCADARAFLTKALACEAELLYPFHCIKDIQYVLERELKRDLARDQGGIVDEPMAKAIREATLGCLRNMADAATAVAGDASDVWLALKYLRINSDLEDNLVLCACHRAKADYLVTSDKGLIEVADVVAKTPAQMVELLSLDDA